MATITHLVTTPDTGNTPNSSAGFTPTSGRLIVVFVTKEASVPSAMVSGDLTCSTGLGFTLIRAVGFNSDVDTLGVFVANAKTTDTTAGQTLTIGSGADAGAGSIISAYEVAGLPAGAVGSAAVRQVASIANQAASTPQPSWDSGAVLTTSACIAAVGVFDGTPVITEPSGWTESQDTGYTTGKAQGIETAFRNSGETGTSIVWQSAASANFCAVGLELDVRTTYTETARVGTIVVTGTCTDVHHVDSGVTERRFDAAATDYIACSIGACNLTGDLTQAMLVRKVGDGGSGSGTIFANHTSAGAAATYFGFNDSNQVYWGTSIAALRTSTTTFTVADGWCLLAVSKAAGTSTPRLHYKKEGGSWQHEDLSNTSGNPASQAGGSVQFCRVENLSSFAPAELCVAAEWNVALNDSQAAELSTNTATNDWITESAGLPRGLWQFNQAAVGTSVTDVTGNGADQSSRSGTTVAVDGLSGWDYLTAFHKENPSGTVVVAGSVIESQSFGGPTNNDNPVGRVILTGSALDAKVATETLSGTVVLTGTKLDAKIGTDARSGVLVVTGTRAEAKVATDSPTGMLVLSGTKTESRSAADSSTGTVVLAGTRADSRTATDTLSGGILLTGTKTESLVSTKARGIGFHPDEPPQTPRDEWIDLAIGNANLTGGFTIAKLWNQPEMLPPHNPDYTVANMTAGGAAGDIKVNFSENGTSYPPGGALQLFVSGGGNDFCGGPNVVGGGNTQPAEMNTAGYLNGWVIHVVTKASGLNIPRYHIYVDGAWYHHDGYVALPDPPSQAGGKVRLMKTLDAITAEPGIFAVLAEWATDLSDAEVEELSVNRRTRDWLDNSAGAPVGCWQFNQASVATPVLDITGNGADQQSITGTFVLDYGPTGWQYETVYNDDVSGAVIVTGSRSESFIGPTTYTDACSGTLVLTGTATRSTSRVSSPSGVVVIAGTRSESYEAAGAVTYDDVATGTIVLTGSKLEARSAADTRSGTTVVTGSKSESYSVAGVYNDSPTGILVLSGTKAEAHLEAPRPSGTLVITGTRTEAYSHSASRSGTVVVTGTRTEFTGKEYTDTRSGALIVTGSRTQDLSRVETPYGSLILAGTVTESISYISALLGKVVVTGSASEQYVPSGAAFHYPVGGIIITGTLEELHGRWDWIDGERWPAGSDARWGEDVGERWNVDVVV